ncbi:MAG: hypothetical protein GF350_04300 [Chitinivibrionales bacterium]|nr:hypothetical protein [Chitinivibrionales bacterium]
MNTNEVKIRIYYYYGSMPYSIDVGPALQPGERVTMDSVGFEIEQSHEENNSNGTIQRLWVRRSVDT